MTMLSRYFWEQIVNIIKSCGIGLLVIGVIGIISPENHPMELINWWLIPVGFFLSVTMITSSRYFLVHWILEKWMRRRFRRQALIIGSNGDATRIATYIINNKAPYWISGTIGKNDLNTPVPKNCLGDLSKLPNIVEQNKIEEIGIHRGCHF